MLPSLYVPHAHAHPAGLNPPRLAAGFSTGLIFSKRLRFLFLFSRQTCSYFLVLPLYILVDSPASSCRDYSDTSRSQGGLPSSLQTTPNPATLHCSSPMFHRSRSRSTADPSRRPAHGGMDSRFTRRRRGLGSALRRAVRRGPESDNLPGSS